MALVQQSFVSHLQTIFPANHSTGAKPGLN